MPEISRFFGIVIRMYFLDHGPPHFHASDGTEDAKLGIDPLVLLGGSLPPRSLKLVMKWATLHQRELLDNWWRLHSEKPALRIKPWE